MTAAHVSSITNVKKFFVVITSFINNLKQYHLVRFIVMYTSMLHWSLLICSHLHPKLFDAGLRSPCHDKCFRSASPQIQHRDSTTQDVEKSANLYKIPFRSIIHQEVYRTVTIWHYLNPWWRDQMKTFSAILALCAGNSPVPGECLSQRPIRWAFDVFSDLRLNKPLSKQSRRRW